MSTHQDMHKTERRDRAAQDRETRKRERGKRGRYDKIEIIKREREKEKMRNRAKRESQNIQTTY